MTKQDLYDLKEMIYEAGRGQRSHDDLITWVHEKLKGIENESKTLSTNLVTNEWTGDNLVIGLSSSASAIPACSPVTYIGYCEPDPESSPSDASTKKSSDKQTQPAE